MDSGQLQRFIGMAKSAGTYYSTCSVSTSQIVAPVTVIDPPAGTGDCLRITGGSDIFSQAQPGILILTRGKFYCGGNIDMYGVLYLPNLDNRADDDMVDVNGNCQVRGSVSVDGPGGITAGQSGGNAKDGNIVYDPNAFSSLYTFGTAGLVQNTWRELPPLG
jgi:hypothetical protein